MLRDRIGAPAATTLLDLLRQRAEQQPDQLAYVFQRDEGSEEDSLTYGGLHQRASVIAGQLQQLGVPHGARILLFYPQGLDYIAAFAGCIYAGMIAVPSPHPHLAGLGRHLARLQGIVESAQPVVVLTTHALYVRAQQLLEQFPFLQTMTWLATDQVEDVQPHDWHEPHISGETIAFLQYTSGSTSAPKGVVLSHANILHNNAMFQHVLQHPPEVPLVSWLPLFHDMGLIASALQALFIGAPCVLLSPQAFIQRPVRWLQTISRYRAHTSCAPNFAYDLCIQKVTPEQRAELDLSCWRMAVNGAEPVQAHTLERFTAAFASCGFQPEAFSPGYGLAESTVFVSCTSHGVSPTIALFDSSALENHRVVTSSIDQQATRRLVGCGSGSPDQRIVIVDPATCALCPEEQVGEIWVAGPSVAQGYWQAPEETARTFEAYLAGTRDGPFLRTGDLGFLQKQQLFITGRLKDVIIIDGRNHYPQDIESTVEQCHAALRPGCSAAFAITRDAQEHVVVVAEVERQYREQAPDDEGQQTGYRVIMRAIRKAVAEQHDLSVHQIALLRPASIPKTSSGKIQRHACRAGFLANTLSRLDTRS